MSVCRTILLFFCLAGVCSTAGAASIPAETVRTEQPASDALSRMAWLRGEIARHDRLYFRDAAPEISDSEYDALCAELRALEKAFPAAVPSGANSAASAAVGDDHAPHFVRRRHRAPMLSLAKTYADDGVRAFCLAVARAAEAGQGAPAQPLFWVEPKFDGVAVSAVYENGRLARVLTRGDGLAGDDVTANARNIAGIPRELRAVAGKAPPRFAEIRGEVYCLFSVFEKQNRALESAGETAFASPRNFAAGTLKLRDSAEAARRGLSVVFYGTGAVEPEPSGMETHGGQLALLREWGFSVPEHARAAGDTAAVLAAVRELEQKRRDLPYPIDGAVIKTNPLALRQKLGSAPDAPRWALAFKYSPERAATTLAAITLQIGSAGAVTPVARLKPARLGGVVVRRATLHNAAHIARLDLREGDTVFVERRGDVIPAVTGVDLRLRPAGAKRFVFPEKCPVCGAPILLENNGAAARHTNPACPLRISPRIRRFASRQCADIAGMGASTTEKLVGAGLVREIPDLYKLSRDDLLAKARLSAAAADKLLAAIERSRRAAPWRILAGMGIEGVGAASAQKLLARLGSLRAVAAATAPELEACGIPPAAARATRAFFEDKAWRDFAGQFSPPPPRSPE